MQMHGMVVYAAQIGDQMPGGTERRDMLGLVFARGGYSVWAMGVEGGLIFYGSSSYPVS